MITRRDTPSDFAKSMREKTEHSKVVKLQQRWGTETIRRAISTVDSW